MRIQQLFERYNQKYFDGSLSSVQVQVQTFDEDEGVNGRWDKETGTIFVSSMLKGRELRETLIHEMAHAACRGISCRGHGVRWLWHMYRAYKLGAPVNRQRFLVQFPEHWPYMDDVEILREIRILERRAKKKQPPLVPLF
jgi:SprT-like family